MSIQEVIEMCFAHYEAHSNVQLRQKCATPISTVMRMWVDHHQCDVVTEDVRAKFLYPTGYI